MFPNTTYAQNSTKNVLFKGQFHICLFDCQRKLSEAKAARNLRNAAEVSLPAIAYTVFLNKSERISPPAAARTPRENLDRRPVPSEVEGSLTNDNFLPSGDLPKA